MRHNLDHLPDSERASVGGRVLRIAIASAPRVKRMAAVIVLGLCRQRRSQLRKQLGHSPPLYQDNRQVRRGKKGYCAPNLSGQRRI
jgi:hypothetical protein